MAFLRFALAVLTLAVSAQAKIKETVIPPHHWVMHGKPSPDHSLRLKIALPQPNFHALEQHLYEVSDPDHERYGHHLSIEEVDALTAPHPETVDAVSEWLASHGVVDDALEWTPSKDWITISVPVHKAEKMLETTYYTWKHAVTGDYLVRATRYGLPEHLHAHVDTIQPSTSFSQLHPNKATFHFSPIASEGEEKIVSTHAAPFVNTASGVTVDASCNKTVTVNCLRQLYNAGNYTPSAKIGNSIGITGYLEENANFADLQQFYADQVPAAANTSFGVKLINGGVNSQNISEAGGEADLDVQFAFGISFPVPATFFSTGGRPPFIPDIGTPTDTNEPYLDWLNFINKQKSVPFAISTSYGDGEQTVPKDYATRVCNEFAKLGARGVSLMFSSGDGGVGDGNPDPATQQCFTNDGKNTTQFLPGFPASCPFVTAVGGTIHIPETGVDFSGGGFSNYFSQPSYQKKAVSTFLKGLGSTYKGLFNPKGRAYPDVSAQSDNFRVFFQGRPVGIGGTSASSPAFTGFVALLNDARLKKKLPPLGFLNPLLYSKGVAGFNDITTGNNPGCGTPGFNATKGWDPVTGLGTPNFGKLKSIVTGH